MAVERRHYQFGPLEQRGMIAGLRGGQVGVLAGSGVVAVGLFRSGRAAGLLLALVVGAAAMVIAFLPVRGATLEQWAPTLLFWGAGSGRRQWLIKVPGLDRGRARGSGGRARGRGPALAAPKPPPALGGLSIIEVVASGSNEPIGIVHDRRSGTFSAILDVRGGAFALLDVADKQRRLAAWATVLASLGRSGTAVARLQWIERTYPAGPDRLPLPNGATAGQPVRPPAGCLESYAELIDEAGPVTQAHETLLVVTMHGREITRRTRGGSDAVVEAVASVVGREVRLLQGHLRTAELIVERVLDAAMCEASMRSAFAGQPQPATLRSTRGQGCWPWPVATEVTWGTYRTDGVWHATYWIAEWPRAEVGPDFLAPLLLQSSGRRTVAVTMVPTDPLDAVRSVEAAKTADAADGELRRRAGFLTSARRQRESQHLLRRETELAEGHADYRFAGFVTVTESELDALQQSCAEVEQLAQRARLELRRLYGRQDAAFTWTLPLGRGLA